MSGPSGAGKSTIAGTIRQRHPELATVTSLTTRSPRPGDGVGKSYDYVTRDHFERLRRAGSFLESAEVHGELYGTPKRAVEEALEAGRDVLLEIDPQGARSVKELVPDAVTIFVNGYDNEIEGFQRKVAFDVLYLQNCSLWNDLKILFRTIGIVLTGKGAL